MFKYYLPQQKVLRKTLEKVFLSFITYKFTLANGNLLQHNPHHVLHRFLYFVLPYWTTRHHKYWIYETICKDKPFKFIIKLYTDRNTLWIKHATHEKAESYIQFYTTWSSTTLSSIQSMVSAPSKVVSAPSFSQPYLCMQPTLQSSPKKRSSTSVNFHPFQPYLFTKCSVQSPPISPYSIPQQFFTSLFLRITIPTVYTNIIFPILTILPI